MKDLPEEPKDKEKAIYVIVAEEDSLRLMRMASHTKILPRPVQTVLDVTDSRGLIQLGPLLEWDGTQKWTTASGVMDTF